MSDSTRSILTRIARAVIFTVVALIVWNVYRDMREDARRQEKARYDAIQATWEMEQLAQEASEKLGRMERRGYGAP